MFIFVLAFFRNHWGSVWFPYVLYEKDDITFVRWIIKTRRRIKIASFLLPSSEMCDTGLLEIAWQTPARRNDGTGTKYRWVSFIYFNIYFILIIFYPVVGCVASWLHIHGKVKWYIHECDAWLFETAQWLETYTLVRVDRGQSFDVLRITLVSASITFRQWIFIFNFSVISLIVHEVCEL